VKVTEVDPICALQAAMDGFEVDTLEDVVARRHLHHHHRQQGRDPHRAHARDEGHGDRRQHRPLRQRDPGRRAEEPQVDQHQGTGGHDRDAESGNRIILLSEGRLLNLGNATGHPSFVMSASFTNQVLAQIELWTKGEQYKNEVYILPKHLDEKVARLHLDRIGVKLTELKPEQASLYRRERPKARSSPSTTATVLRSGR
jgi:adenosylhomocysteinase